MSNKKISELDPVSELYEGCCFPVVSLGETKKVTFQKLKEIMNIYEKPSDGIPKSDLSDEVQRSVENAKKLNPTQYVFEREPYLVRETGGSAEIETFNKVKEELVGCTIGWNQLLQDEWYQSFARSHNNKSGLTITKNADLSIHISGTTSSQFKNYTDCTATYIQGHQYLIIADKSDDVQIFNGYGGTYADAIVTYNNTTQTRLNHIYVQIVSGKTINTDVYLSIIDLTVAFGQVIADKLKSMGSNGVTWCRNWLKTAKHSYSAVTLQNVNVSEKKITLTDNTINTYQLDSALELKGILKLDSNNKFYADGDIYKADGTVIRNYVLRTYQSGDESLTDVITDGTNTIVKLTTPIIEQAKPYQQIQIVDEGGSEEFIDAGVEAGTRDVSVPVGHNSYYLSNDADLIEGLSIIGDFPINDGEYSLETLTNNGTPNVRWVKKETDDYPESEAPIVKGISHRGWRYAPQETIIAYQEAVDKGFKYLECDIRKTSDNKYVLVHNVNVSSATAGASSATVIGSTLAQLKAMNFNYGMTSYGTVRVATLEEFLEFCRDNNVNAYLELKRDASLTETDIVNLIALTHKYGMENHVTWTSFSSELLRYVNKHNTHSRLCYLCDFYDSATHGTKDKYYTDDIQTLLSIRPNVNNIFICPNLANILDSNHTDRENAKFEACLSKNIPMEVYVSVDPYNETIEAEWFAKAQTITENTPYRKMIGGFIIDYTDATAKAKTGLPWYVEEKKVTIFNDSVHPLYPTIQGQTGNPTLQADLSKFKKLYVYYTMPAAQGVITVNLENSGHISGIDVYTASAVCGGYDNERRLSIMTVTVNQNKTTFTVLRAGWMGFEFASQPTPTPIDGGSEYRYSHWEARSADYNVVKIEGVL